MAAVSTLPVSKRKKQGYGKVNSRSNWNVGSFFDEDELATTEPSQPARQRQTDVNALHPMKKTEMKIYGVNPARPRPKRHDTFDVPSSDDEIASTTKTVRTSGFQVRSTPVDDTDSSVAQLAPWERRRVQSDREVTSYKRRQAPASPEAQLKQDLERATLSPERNKTSSPSPKGQSNSRHGIGSSASPRKELSAGESSAAARLAARRKEEARPLAKRTALATEEIESTPSKRARTATPSRASSEDVVMTDTLAEPTCQMPQEEARTAEGDGDIYDFPASSGDELSRSKSRIERPKAVKRTMKRGKLTVHSSKPTAKKGISAPARLAEMVATDTDATEPPTRSPSATSRRSTPQQTPSTPPSGKLSSPETAIKAKVTMTPKQAQLWSQLLPSDPAVPSPSALAIKDLSISGKRRTESTSFTRRLTKSQSDVPVRRTRLVDRLKASAPNSDDEISEEDEEDVPEMTGENHVEQRAATAPEKLAPLERKPSQTSQSQSQTSVTATSGPKITYSSMRSFLPEDNLEEDLMAGLDSGTPMHSTQSKAVGKSAPISQRSAFDINDMDDDGGSQGGIRTIHELRASGRTISGMYDIEELLSEIQNHNLSHRSRRRSALIELAKKLTDKAFATRFVGQSLETELAVECGAASDEIADFVLAAAVALIAASEPPEHAVRSLHDQGVVAWLAKLLNKDTDIIKLAKDRRNNMSKSAQGSLTDFAHMLKTQTSWWDEEKPIVMAPRLIALKALDLLISKLRRLGDRSVLMGADQVPLILPTPSIPLDEERQIDVALSISVLELLSTTAASFHWPSSSIETIAEVLPRLNTDSSMQRHALFLMLRLCLNLTNDNTRNCELLSSSINVVRYLVNAIKQGFDSLDLTLEDEKRALALDLLVLAMGIMINLAEKCDTAREHAMRDEDSLLSLIAIFQRGQKHMLDAESVEESVSNVAFGYLAVMLSNICLNREAKTFIASKLPRKNLGMLVEAVEEFVLHHQKVDMMNFEGEEGAEVWGAFTEKLKMVLARLKEAEHST